MTGAERQSRLYMDVMQDVVPIAQYSLLRSIEHYPARILV
jgi:hypothetical protein